MNNDRPQANNARKERSKALAATRRTNKKSCRYGNFLVCPRVYFAAGWEVPLANQNSARSMRGFTFSFPSCIQPSVRPANAGFDKQAAKIKTMYLNLFILTSKIDIIQARSKPSSRRSIADLIMS
ncbi:hypothetical protein [Methylotuvimicrobium sp.]|uniref:hypothetical protein n=1 Tax=Methylotuvimicrobium sp. TaxID=2822413 RepID=UPI003D660332